METLDYNKLLEKYFEGLTTLKEENELMLYLKQYKGDNPDILDAKIMFTAIESERADTIDLDFTGLFETRKVSKIRKMLVYGGSVAAAAVIILAVTILVRLTQQPVVYAYINGNPITDKKIAMEYSKQAMMDISVHLNKGTENLNVIRTLNKPAELLTNIKQ